MTRLTVCAARGRDGACERVNLPLFSALLLRQDCMEEINLFSENKTHLKQLGEQLITASNKTKETDANDKLKDINDRWQHLFDHIETRWGQRRL